MDIFGQLRKMQETREWDRANPENPVCQICNRRDRPDMLNSKGICAECLDDSLQSVTGYRHGEFNCSHDECQER